jgi:hypothetical protein
MAAKKTARKKTSSRRPRRRVNLRRMSTRAQRGEVGPTAKARLILTHAHESADAFLDAFAGVRRLRGARSGTSTDEEQDLLRAMLVMAAAGLDSMAKQLIRDSLPDLIQCDPNVREGLETFVARQLRGDSEGGAAASGNRFLARMLVSESQRDQLIEEYILHLTGTSLQSADELMRTATALGLEPGGVGIEKAKLKPIFDVRNKIIHELDINFDHPNRNRESRSQPRLTEYTNNLLEVGEKILDAVQNTLGGAA